jgi:DNA-binding IclR family transcriptional regulator
MDSVSGVGVIDKAVVLLRALRAGPHDLAELQVATHLPRATAHRLLVALEKHHLVRRDPQGRFVLGFELVALGHAAAEQFALGDLAAPVLRRLRDDCGESVQLYVREDDGRRCVASLQSPHALRWIVAEGSVLPLGVGSAGRILGAQPPAAPWVESVEEREPGVASVSSPVVDRTSRIIAAISISGPVERLSRQPGLRFGQHVAQAAAELSAIVARALR